MSSLLNASSRPEEFSLKDIEVLVDNKEQNWFKRAHVGKFLGIEDIRTSLNDLESSVKWSDPVHFLKSQGNFFWSFPCTLFLHIFDT